MISAVCVAPASNIVGRCTSARRSGGAWMESEDVPALQEISRKSVPPTQRSLLGPITPAPCSSPSTVSTALPRSPADTRARVARHLSRDSSSEHGYALGHCRRKRAAYYAGTQAPPTDTASHFASHCIEVTGMMYEVRGVVRWRAFAIAFALTAGACGNDRAIDVPVVGMWASVEQSGPLRGRVRHTAVWTGDEMIVWGGASTRSRASHCTTTVGDMIRRCVAGRR